MTLAIHFGLSEWQFTTFLQGLIFVVATVYVLLLLSKVKRAGLTTHLKWLVPLTIYTVNQAVTYAVANAYSLLNAAEPEPLNTITDVMDDVSLLAFLWALIVLWRIIRTAPDLLKTPWLDRGETPEGVWPPAPRA